MQEIFQMLETQVRRRRAYNEAGNPLASAFVTFEDLIEIIEECRFQAAEKEEKETERVNKLFECLQK